MKLGRFSTNVKNALRQGISPRKLALTATLGLIVGILPLVWGTSLLCAILAFRFGLNQAGIQAANYIAYPLQIILLLPFYRIGAWIFPGGGPLHADIFRSGFENDWGGHLRSLAMATCKALAAWSFLAPPAAVLIYFLLLRIFSRMTALKSTN
jgi:uncharacterized protein (DUF2062 family)